MKIRNGFVSNSSSSSFIIAYKESEVCPTCGNKAGDFLEALRSSLDRNDDNGIYCESYTEVRDELTCRFNDMIECDSKNAKSLNVELATIIKRMDELKLKGFNFASIGISYHDEILNDLLQNNKFVEVLYSGGD